MPNNNFKNIVVLKNLPSNLIDEAIVILKSNKSAKKLEFVEKNPSSFVEEKIYNEDYIIKEAESVIENYISKIEKNKLNRRSKNNIEVKYKKIKIYRIIVSLILIYYIIRVLI